MAAPVETARDTVCDVALEGLGGALGGQRRIFGGDSLQALLLGVQFLGVMLHRFVEDGGHVLDREGNDATLQAIFGPLLRGPD